MLHIAVNTLPGRTTEVKQTLAAKLRDALIELLAVDEQFVSVSVEDVEPGEWDLFMNRFAEENVFVDPNKKSMI